MKKEFENRKQVFDSVVKGNAEVDQMVHEYNNSKQVEKDYIEWCLQDFCLWDAFTASDEYPELITDFICNKLGIKED